MLLRSPPQNDKTMFRLRGLVQALSWLLVSSFRGRDSPAQGLDAAARASRVLASNFSLGLGPWAVLEALGETVTWPRPGGHMAETWPRPKGSQASRVLASNFSLGLGPWAVLEALGATVTWPRPGGDMAETWPKPKVDQASRILASNFSFRRPAVGPVFPLTFWPGSLPWPPGFEVCNLF